MRLLLEEDLAPCQDLDEGLEATRKTLRGLRDDGHRIYYVAGMVSSEGDHNIERNVRRLEAERVRLMHRLGDGALTFTATFIFTRDNLDRWGMFKLDREERETRLRDFFRTVIIEKLVDRVYLAPGWNNSVGTNLEREVALEAGVPVIDIEHDEALSRRPHSVE